MKRKNKGFTIVELVIVIAVIAILAAVLIPTFTSVIDNANNSSDKQLVANMNTVLATNLNQGEDVTVESLHKLLADNGLEDLTTKKEENTIVYNKAKRQVEIIQITETNVTEAYDNGYVTVDDGEKFEIDSAAYYPEEILKGYIITSTGGNALSEGLYKLHNWESAPNDGSDILKNLYADKNFESIKIALTTIISETLYADKGGSMFRLSAAEDGSLTVVGPTESLSRVVFNEECTTLNLNTLSKNLAGTKGLIVILPQTLTTVGKCATAGALNGVTLAGNVNIVKLEESATSGVGVSDKSISEIQELYENPAKLALANQNEFYVSDTANEEEYTYKDLQKALNKAQESANLLGTTAYKNVILVVKTYTVGNDITIPENVILKLPYDGTNTYGSPKEKATGTDVLSFGDTNKGKLLISVNDGVTITNNGKIEVGGYVTGSGGGHMAGQTTGDYARIDLGANAKIESYGDMDVYGFITETAKNNNSQVIMHSGTMKMPFVVVEHRGGSIFYAVGMENGFGNPPTAAPFNRFFLHNVSCALRLESNSKLLGDAKLATSSFIIQENQTNISLIGNDNKSLIQLKEGSYVVAKLQANSFSQDNAKSPIKLDVYGDMTLNSMSLEITVLFSTITVTTNSVLFPVSWYWQISFNPIEERGTAIVDATAQDFKILPGGSVTVNKGVTLKAGKIAVYKEDSWTDAHPGASAYESGKGNGKLTVNGSLIVDVLGGEIQNCAKGNEGSITINRQLVSVSQELESSSGSQLNTKVQWKTITLNLSFVSGTPDGTGTYTFKSGTWTKQPVQ